MAVNRIFNAKAFPETKEITLDQRIDDTEMSSVPSAKPNAGSTTPVFLTPQSIATFPGASIAINLIWNISAAIYEPFAQMKIVPIGASLLIGVIIFYQSYTENMSKADKVLAIFVAVINSLWLAAITLGINIGSPPGT